MGGGAADCYEDMETPPPEDAMNRIFLMGYPSAALAYDHPERDCIECLRRATELRQAHKDHSYASGFPDNTGPGFPEWLLQPSYNRVSFMAMNTG